MRNLLPFLKSIKTDKRLETFDEAATKQAVVLRILSSIGWDTFDIDEVQPEYSVMNTRVDFSLRLNHANKVFIEVKKISEDLDRHQEQLLNYSFQEGVKLAILTNGTSMTNIYILETLPSGKKLAYSVNEISKLTTLSKPFLRNKIREGSLKVTRFGRRVLILRADLEKFLDSGSG